MLTANCRLRTGDFLLKAAALFIFCTFFPFDLFAHVIPYDLNKLSQTDIGWVYLKLGYTHILPSGYDHVLFILGIFFLNPHLKSVLWQATAFTVAHSITLGLAMYGLIKPPGAVIEAIIALSIVFVAVENIFTAELRWWRVLIVFCFGLVHGCGFASALTQLGLPPNDYLLSLVSFNLGVELGQVTIILIAYFAVGKWFADKKWYHRRIVIPVSLAIGVIALYWTVERTIIIYNS
jgi:hypothetical protein